MARMTKKTVARTALVEALAARGAQLAERDEITAVVRGCLQRSGMHFCEREVDGRIFFSGDFLTDESVVLIIPWAISVSDDLIVISCTIPLRVPKSKRDAIALYANEVNAEGHGIGTKSVLDFVKKTGSEIRYIAENGMFKVRMLIG